MSKKEKQFIYYVLIFIVIIVLIKLLGPKCSENFFDDTIVNTVSDDNVSVETTASDDTVSVANTVSDGTVKLANKIENSKTGKTIKKVGNKIKNFFKKK